MYLARQPQGNGFSESRTTVADNVIVIEGKRSETSGSQEPQSRSQPQLQSQSQLWLQQPLPPLTTTSSANTRDRQTDPMRQHPSAWRLKDDDGGDDDDDDDDDDDYKNEEEQVDDNFSTATERRAPPRVILVGWDTFRTRLLLFLIVCLLVWVCVFFPLLGT